MRLAFPRIRSERPHSFRLRPDAPLGNKLRFAMLGQCPGGATCVDSSPFRENATLNQMDPPTDWVRSRELGRWGIDFSSGTEVMACAGPCLRPENTTIAFWSITDAVTSGWQARLIEGSTERIYQDDDPTSTWYFTIEGGTDVLTLTGAPGLNELWHCAITYIQTGATADVIWYINGKVGASGSIGAKSVQNKTLWGNNSATVGSRGFDGRMYDPMVWYRALGQREIQALADPSNVMLEYGSVPLLEEPFGTPRYITFPSAVALLPVAVEV